MILLTFNLFNSTANRKNGGGFTLEERSKITFQNAKSILRTLEIHDVKSTFFCEVKFAGHNLELLKLISSKGHEVAFFQENSNIDEIERVKHQSQDVIGKQIRGIRQRDDTLRISDLKQLEFNYVSNIENSNILFPFKRLVRDTEINEIEGISIVPESISPYSQLPYNDFVFQILPTKYYEGMVSETLKNDEFVLIYLNSIQFTDLSIYPFKVPFYRRYNSGKKMEDKLDEFLTWINKNELAVSRMKDFVF